MADFHIPTYGYYRDELLKDTNIDKRFAVKKYFKLKFDGLLNSGRSEKRPILLIGSGFSISSGIPDWHNSIKYIIHRYSSFVKSRGAKYLISRGIIDQVEELFNRDDGPEHLIDLAEYIKIQFLRFRGGKDEWQSICIDLFKGVHQPNNNHYLLAQMFPRISGIITTNYDILIEEAIREIYPDNSIPNFDINKNVYKYYEADRLEEDFKLNPNLKYIIKIHGCISDDDLYSNIVIGRKDYARLMIDNGKMFKCFSDLYRVGNRPFISLGYSISDRDLLNLIAYMEEKIMAAINAIVIDSMTYPDLINESKIKANDTFNWMNTHIYNMFYLPYPVSDDYSNRYVNFETVLESLNECLN